MRRASFRSAWSRSSCARSSAASAALALLIAACTTAAQPPPEVQAVGDRSFPPRPATWPVAVCVSPRVGHAERIAEALGDARVGLGPAHALVIGAFQVTAKGYGEPAPLERAREKARSIGGDAIVVLDIVSLTDTEDENAEGRPMKGWRLTGRVLRVYP